MAVQQIEAEFDGAGSLYANPATKQQGVAHLLGSGTLVPYLSFTSPLQLGDGISFIAASAGTGTFVYGSPRPSFLTLAQAVADGELFNTCRVSYLAQDSASPTQREWGHGVFSSFGNGSIARTQVLGGSAGPGVAVNFSVAPIVSLTVLAEDFSSLIQPASTLLLANGQLLWYVSPTGNDANDGLSVTTAFATIQHAVNATAQYDYQNLYFPTVRVLDGGYVITATIVLPALKNLGYVTGSPVLLFNPTTVDNVVLDGTALAGNGTNSMFGTAPGARWVVGGFKANLSAAVFRPSEGGSITCNGDVILDDTSDSFFLRYVTAQNTGSFGCNGTTITVLATYIEGVFQAQDFARMSANNCTIVLQPNTTTGDLLFITGTSSFSFIGSQFVDINGNQYGSSPLGGGIPGDGSFVLDHSVMYADFGYIPYPLPGCFDHIPDTLTIDPLSLFDSGGFGSTPFPIIRFGDGPPASMDDYAWIIQKDKTIEDGNGGIGLFVSDGGSLFGVPIGTNPINRQTASYVLTSQDCCFSFILEMDVATPHTVTIPNFNDVNLPPGVAIRISQVGVGQTTIVPDVGVTLRSAGGANKIAQQWGGATLYQRAIGNEWVLLGNITT